MARKQHLAALAEAGIAEEDQRQIDKARRIIDAVNARLAQRDAPLMFVIMTANVQPVRATWPSEITEN